MSERKYQLDPNVEYTIWPYQAWAWLYDAVDFSNLTTLEIGGSQSDISVHFRQKGAKAFALDLAHANLDQLQEMVEKTLVESEDPEHVNAARDAFKKDLSKNPSFYIAGSATNMPFRPEQFDIIHSGQCICPILSANREPFEAALAETVRVLKPDGVAYIFPYDNHEQIFKGKRDEARIQQINLDRGERLLNKLGVFSQKALLSYNANNPTVIDTRYLLTIKKPTNKRVY